MNAAIETPIRLLEAPDLRVCNCAVCGATLLGERMAAEIADGLYGEVNLVLPPRVSARINGRPVCGDCFKRLLASEA